MLCIIGFQNPRKKTMTEKDMFETFMDIFCQEVMDMSDEEIMGNQDPEALKKEALEILESAKKDSGLAGKL